jgi:hypothetical protein
MILMSIIFLLCLIILAIGLPVIIIRGLKRHSWQFSLKSLLIFITVFAIWLSQFTCKPFSKFRESFDWRSDFTVIFVWIVLAGFYLYRQYIVTLSVHCLAILLCELFLAYAWASNARLTSLSDIGWYFMIGCFFGSLISFPTWILELCRFTNRSMRETSAVDRYDLAEDQDSAE